MRYDYKLNELYDMTLKELDMSLENKKIGLAYRLWKEGMLNQWLEKYPDTAEEACPELYPPKPTIKKPACLNKSNLKRKGGEMIYE